MNLKLVSSSSSFRGASFVSTFGCALAMFAFGCAADPTAPPGGDDQEAKAASPESAAEGSLALETSASDHVTGSFTKDGVTLGFDLSAEGGARHAHLIAKTPSATVELLDASLSKDGIETSKLLGGRLVVSGAPDSIEPKMEGDLTVLDDLATLPEARLVTPMKDALRAAHVDDELFRFRGASRAGSQSSVTPQGRLANVTLDAGQSVRVPTWSFWAVTTILMINLTDTGNSYVWMSITTYNGMKQYYPILWKGGQNRVTGQWWGAPVTVKNENIWVGTYVRVDAD